MPIMATSVARAVSFSILTAPKKRPSSRPIDDARFIGNRKAIRRDSHSEVCGSSFLTAPTQKTTNSALCGRSCRLRCRLWRQGWRPRGVVFNFDRAEKKTVIPIDDARFIGNRKSIFPQNEVFSCRRFALARVPSNPRTRRGGRADARPKNPTAKAPRRDFPSPPIPVESTASDKRKPLARERRQIRARENRPENDALAQGAASARKRKKPRQRGEKTGLIFCAIECLFASGGNIVAGNHFD